MKKKYSKGTISWLQFGVQMLNNKSPGIDQLDLDYLDVTQDKATRVKDFSVAMANKTSL